MLKNCYEVLQINRFASQKEIKQAYKKLAFQFHPDRNQNNPNAEERFKLIFEAYKILSDPEAKRKHDQHVFMQVNQTSNSTNYQFKFSASIDLTKQYEAEMAAMRSKQINPNKEWSGSFFFFTLGLLILGIIVLGILLFFNQKNRL
ncbi:MAG: DnaJ domain-containing protein [Cytophagales bacterium]